MTVFWIALAAAAGFLVGHYRLLSRAFGRLVEFTQAGSSPCTARRYAVESLAFLLLVLAFATRPRRTVRNVRSWRRPVHKESAPEMDSGWGRP